MQPARTSTSNTLHTIATVHEACGHEPHRVASRSSPVHHSEDSTRNSVDIPPAPTNSEPRIASDHAEGAGPILRTLSRLSPFGALLSRTLPEYRGPHHVGVFDIEIPVREPRHIGSFLHKGLAQDAGQPGFELETVLFSVFYPAERSRDESKVVWFPRLSQTVNGFLKMARRTGWLYKTLAYPIAAAAIYGTTFPASPEAPLKRPQDGQQWPLLIFSHGVGCSRLMYSSFCGEMASRGYIVCAVEHRDGSGPSSSIKLANGTVQDVEFVDWQELHWPIYSNEEQPKDETRLRHDQLALRKAEIEEIIVVMQDITAGKEIEERSVRSPHWDWKRWGPEWNSVNVKRPIMTGHSLGGSAALLAASDTEKNDFRCIVAYDPACQRLEPWTGEIPCPLLCINSEEYTTSDEFKRLQSLAETAPNPPIYSISGSTHPSFSDVFLIVPGFINRRTGLKIDADEMLNLTIEMTMAFITGKSALKNSPFVTEWGGPIETPLGKPGDVNWHPNVSQIFSAAEGTQSGGSGPPTVRASNSHPKEADESRDAQAQLLGKTASRMLKTDSKAAPEELLSDHA